MYQKELLRIKLNLTYKEVMGETQRKERLKGTKERKNERKDVAKFCYTVC